MATTTDNQIPPAALRHILEQELRELRFLAKNSDTDELRAAASYRVLEVQRSIDSTFIQEASK